MVAYCFLMRNQKNNRNTTSSDTMVGRKLNYYYSIRKRQVLSKANFLMVFCVPVMELKYMIGIG